MSVTIKCSIYPQIVWRMILEFSLFALAASLLFSPSPIAATNQPTCSNWTLSAFTIRALYTDPALNVGLPANGLPINVYSVGAVPHIGYSVLTVNTPILRLDGFHRLTGTIRLAKHVPRHGITLPWTMHNSPHIVICSRSGQPLTIPRTPEVHLPS
jgi:hypothetical protein